MDDRLDTRRVRYFMQVLESGSVRGAADVLGQVALELDREIASLEHRARTQDRTSRKAQPRRPCERRR